MKFFFNGGSYLELITTLKEIGHSIIDHKALWLHNISNDVNKIKAYNTLLKSEISRTKPDVYLCTKALKNRFRIFPETHEWIRKKVGITVYWSQDDPFFMPVFLQQRLYVGYKIALSCTRASFNDYRSVNLKPYMFWPAFDSIYRKHEIITEEEKIDFVFVGSPYMVTKPPRKQSIFGLINAGIKNIEIYGNKLWIVDGKTGNRDTPNFMSGDSRLKPYYRGQVSWGIVHQLYAKARLNLSNHVRRADMYLNDRVPMVMGVGGFLFLDRNPGLDTMFEHENEVVFYDNHKDFVKKAKYYINKPDERLRIGNNAKKKALERHTYQNRARQLLNILRENGIK